MTEDAGFKLTYSTMSDPPEALHERFEAVLARVKGTLGRDYPMWVAEGPRVAAQKFEIRSPIARVNSSECGLTAGFYGARGSTARATRSTGSSPALRRAAPT